MTHICNLIFLLYIIYAKHCLTVIDMLSLHFTFSVYLRNHTITILDSRVTLFSFSKYKRNTVFSSRSNAILQKYNSVSKDKTQRNYICSSIRFGSSTAIMFPYDSVFISRVQKKIQPCKYIVVVGYQKEVLIIGGFIFTKPSLHFLS